MSAISRPSPPVRSSPPSSTARSRSSAEAGAGSPHRSGSARVRRSTRRSRRRSKPGLAVRRGLLERRLERSLENSLRTRIAVPTRPVEAERTRATFGPVIWISRGSNTLHLYNGEQAVRTFGVATGQSQYPTPSGLWHIADMQLNPWWRPPDSPWAQGLEPIPPGPGNPLGTRWMGLDAAGVGIHGTPDAASIGYSASHGCIRMQIPDAEWLFNYVTIGTPVYIT